MAIDLKEQALKPETVAFLEGLCFASNITWTEAGMGFELIVDRMREPERLPAGIWERPFLVTDHSVPLPANTQLQELARFVLGAIGGNADRTPNGSETRVANTLMLRLHRDLAFDRFCVELEECDFGMDLKLLMATEGSGQLATLRMRWRVD